MLFCYNYKGRVSEQNMNNVMWITHIVKTDSLSKTQLIVRTKCSCWCHLRETYIETKKKWFEENTIQKLDLRL